MEEELYKRQKLIEGLKIPETVSVVGCGGTGFWTALMAAMSGVQNVILVDADTVEESNFNRLIANYGQYAGYNKTGFTQNIIHWCRPKCRVEQHTVMLKTPNDCSILRGTIFCCTDNMKSQQLLCAYAKKNNLPYQRVGYDGTVLNVSRAFPLSFDANVAPGYRIDPSWVVPAVTAAALALFSQFKSEITITEGMERLHCMESTDIPEELKSSIIRSSNIEGQKEGYRQGVEIGEIRGIMKEQKRRNYVKKTQEKKMV